MTRKTIWMSASFISNGSWCAASSLTGQSHCCFPRNLNSRQKVWIKPSALVLCAITRSPFRGCRAVSLRSMQKISEFNGKTDSIERSTMRSAKPVSAYWIGSGTVRSCHWSAGSRKSSFQSSDTLPTTAVKEPPAGIVTMLESICQGGTLAAAASF